MRILVADPDLRSAALTAFLLTEAGYEVVKAADGPGMLHALAHHQPDLVLLEAALPPTDGFDLCRQIRNGSDVPIIFLAVRSQGVDRVLGLRLGGDDYLAKPYEPAELLARIEAVLRRRTGNLLDTRVRRKYGVFVLDPLERTVVVRDGHTIRLTPLEFRLLYYLMQQPGYVHSPSQILRVAWGSAAGSDTKMVASYIRRLRTKIEFDPDHPQYIRTVRSMGYRFEADPESVHDAGTHAEEANV